MSASSMKMVFAFGMSRPLSMIVVATRMSASLRTNADHRLFEFVRVHLAVPDDDLRLGHDHLHLVGDLVDVVDAVVDEVHLPAAVHLAQDRVADELVVPADDARLDRLAVRRRRFEVARSRGCPAATACSVRGIGVAVIVSTSTVARSCFSRSLCSTPNRCSSSMTTRPRSLNFTSFESSRCVPTMTSTSPAATLLQRLLLLRRRS